MSPTDPVAEALVFTIENNPELARRLAAALPQLAATTELIDAHEYADRYGLHLKTVQKAARDGRIAGARRIGRNWHMPADAPLEPVGRATAPSTAPRRRTPAPRRTPTTTSTAEAIRGARVRKKITPGDVGASRGLGTRPKESSSMKKATS